ncbi:MAG: DUF2721 domain-containing protein [Anaerolineales bacterium]|nr:DUF2721 domain-containing protein [Anaerolineales bacterium]
MNDFSLTELVPILQTAIGPVILISGVGLLLLSMTNRLGRVIDRSRILVHELRDDPAVHKEIVMGQIRILAKRAKLLQQSIILVTVSVLFAAVLIIALFLTALFHFEYAWLISTLFIGCLAALICALVIFIRDLNLSLEAFKMDIMEENLDILKEE